MAYRLTNQSIEQAIAHICRFGDTDIFPHLPELAFLADAKAKVVAELSQLDLDSFNPSGATECLAPKSKLGFRIAHQLGPIDTVILLACVIELGPAIEKRRRPGARAFSYRFQPGSDGQLFEPNHTYRRWLVNQEATIEKHGKEIEHVLWTDISDFYARINFHRLENYLDECAPGAGAARFIKKHIKIIRAKQSFGLPVGGAAARLLAELSLCDTDRLLEDNGIDSTRYVDDFRLFLRKGQEPYDVLASLAEQLGINEGLSLNVAKTIVYNRDEFEEKLSSLLVDPTEDAGHAALETLTSDIYSDGDPDEEDISKLRNLNLIEFLREELAKDQWDVGRIKVIFRALKITRKEESIEFIIDEFESLLIFAKELVLLMQALELGDRCCFDVLLERVIKAVLRPPAASVQLIQAWLLELFVRDVITLEHKHINEFTSLASPIHKRQLLLIRGRLGDVNYFRSEKTAIDQFSNVEQTCLVWGAACLPDDELKNWLPAVKGKMTGPCSALFCDWVFENKKAINKRLGAPPEEHAE
ncbi:MAG: hypothetical protein B7Y90_16815 [Alphaproteobacteria bacterium 32-64-14]|nr:MAG: hypothetical protein B7Y90_16815 [Alphaproteobacteria bacterium 32-64-14]